MDSLGERKAKVGTALAQLAHAPRVVAMLPIQPAAVRALASVGPRSVLARLLERRTAADRRSPFLDAWLSTWGLWASGQVSCHLAESGVHVLPANEHRAAYVRLVGVPPKTLALGSD